MTATIRAAADDDAASLLELERAVVLAREGMVTTEADLPGDASGYLEDLRASPARRDGVWLVAVDGARVLGQVTVARLRPSLLRHVGLLAVQVHPKAQGRGLGRALMARAIAWASGADVSRLELYVRADNARARRLYESLGFVVEGVRRDFVRLPDGAFVDDLVMARLLGPSGATVPRS